MTKLELFLLLFRKKLEIFSAENYFNWSIKEHYILLQENWHKMKIKTDSDMSFPIKVITEHHVNCSKLLNLLNYLNDTHLIEC